MGRCRPYGGWIVSFQYICFIETTVTTQHVVEGIAVDYAADGRIAGIEILGTRKRFGDTDVFRSVLIEDISLTKPTPVMHS